MSLAIDNFDGYSLSLKDKNGGIGWASPWAEAAANSSAGAINASLGGVSIVSSTAPFVEYGLTGNNLQQAKQ